MTVSPAVGEEACLETLIHRRLAALAPLRVDLVDESAQHVGHKGNTGGGHYRLQIVAACFHGLDRLARHRLVHRCLGELLDGRVHALTIRALTAEELDPVSPAVAGNPRFPLPNL